MWGPDRVQSQQQGQDSSSSCSQAVFEGGILVLGCRGRSLKSYPGWTSGWGFPSQSVGGYVACSMPLAEGRTEPCFMKANIKLVSHALGPLVRAHLERNLFSPKELGMLSNTNAPVFWCRVKQARERKTNFTFPSLSCAWNKKMKVGGGLSVIVSGKCLL